MHVIRDRTDQLDNKDIATKEFIERNEQHIETILDSFRCSYCIYHLKTFGCSYSRGGFKGGSRRALDSP